MTPDSSEGWLFKNMQHQSQKVTTDSFRVSEDIRPDFYLMGYFGKDLVKAMLEKAGYSVCQYSYEETLRDYFSKHTSKTSNSNTGRRIRKSPDLLVYDENIVKLAEVKMRTKLPPWFDEMPILREFWGDAILVIIVPEANVFYGQEIAKLELGAEYPLTKFRKIQEIFTRVSEEYLPYYRSMGLQALRMFMTEGKGHY